MIRNPNLSTEYQPRGSGRDPSDTVDRNADSRDYANGGDGGPQETRGIAKKDSATAKIDDKGRPYPDEDTDA